MPDAAPSPDDKRVFLLLRKTGLEEEEAYTLVQELQNMAAANLIARFESKLEALGSQQSAMIAAQNAKIDSLRWVLGAGLAALGLLIAVLRLFA